MKLPLTLGSLAAVLAVGTAQADVFVFTENVNIPIGNPVGLAPVGDVSTIPTDDVISGLTVGLNVSGGYNGALTAYLEAPNGSTVSLFNRPGLTGGNPFGYGGSGLNVTFSDTASTKLQTTPETFGSAVTGNYQAIGSLSTVDGLNDNGLWTLYIADDVAGGGQPVLANWSLDLTVIPAPEPSQALAGVLVVGAALGLTAARRRFRTPRRN